LGDVFDAARQAHDLGVQTCPILMTGPGGEDIGLRALVESALGRATWWPCLQQESVSVWVGDHCFTAQSSASMHEMPANVRQQLEEAAWTVITPMAARDARFVARLVRLARRSILMLSGDQLSSADVCFRLMSRSNLSVVDQAGLEQLTGLADPREAVQRVRERGIGNIVVPGRAGVMAVLDGDWHWRPSYASGTKRTTGADAVFVGMLAAGLTQRRSWNELLELATAALAVHTAGEDAGMIRELRRVISAGHPAQKPTPGRQQSGWACLRCCVPTFLRRPFE